MDNTFANIVLYHLFWRRTAELKANLVLGKGIGEGIYVITNCQETLGVLPTHGGFANEFTVIVSTQT